MAVIVCGFCKRKQEVSFFEFWNCYDCGASWAIRLEEYTSVELFDVFAFFAQARAAYPRKLDNHVLVLAHELSGSNGGDPVALIDSLLLFFDAVVVPDFSIEQTIDLLGQQKAEAYRTNGLVLCSDNSFVETLAHGTLSPEPYTAMFDLELADPGLERTPQIRREPGGSVRDCLCRVVENLEHVYLNQLHNLLSRTNLFNRNRVGDTNTIILNGQEYIDSVLANVIPARFMRNELFCRISGADLLADGYYAVANTFREVAYSEAKHTAEANLFREWLKTTRFPKRVLLPDQVLDFRATWGTLGPFIADIRSQLTNEEHARDSKVVREFAATMDARIAHYHKVMGKGHDVRAMYLQGLLSTLGSIVGGAAGAVVGGVAGIAASHLALEYDRHVAPQLSFIANNLVDLSRS